MTTLMLHARGARTVTRAELEAVPCPEAEGRWKPIPHKECLSLVLQELQEHGYAVHDMKLGLSQGDQRFYGALLLDATLVPGVKLAVGIASSLDKSVALRFGCGHQTLACSNLAYASQTAIAKKHTKKGADTFRRALGEAVQKLSEYREIEAERIRRMRSRVISDHFAEAFLLRAYHDEKLLSCLSLPKALAEWRSPNFPDLEAKHVWRLFSAVTYALRERSERNPQAHVRATVRLSSLLALPEDTYERQGVSPAA